jgi:hypothetical protein
LRKYYYILLSLIVYCSCTTDSGSTDGDRDSIDESLFTLLPPDSTRIDFVNTLNEGLNTNVLLYEYFYNGGGVAAGDLNGDGLVDLYFTSNMGNNKIYLNRGDFKFQDITKICGAAGRPGPWKTGVSLVDINGDQKLDIYLCYSGALPDEKRTNQLFINKGTNANGTPTFREAAAEYGLNSPAYSNQSYWFDYDRDGDLDMILLNHNPKSLPVLNENSTQQLLAKDDPLQGVRLYQNKDGRFEDVTRSAQISGSALTYGLGVGIADFNQDGWPDFYVSNDYTIPDYLYINQGDGTFDNQLQKSLRYNSHFSMGNDVTDINNDALPDIFSLDMLPEDNRRQKLLTAPDNYPKYDLNVRSGFYHQYMRNMLQINNGNGTFTEIGQLAGISNTDWSWAALAADYDNNGWKDLYITNGYHRDYTNLDFINYMNDFVASKGRLKREDVMEVINNMPASDVVNYMYSNEDLNFKNQTKAWGLYHVSNSNGAAYADLDKDGDLDLIVNNINKPAFIFRNEARQKKEAHYLQVRLEGANQNTQALGAKVQIFYGDKTQYQEVNTARGYLSSVDPVLHFGLASVTEVDSIIVIWPKGKVSTSYKVPVDQRLSLSENDSNNLQLKSSEDRSLFAELPSPIPFQGIERRTRDFDRQSLLTRELSHQSPCFARADFNDDGLDDLFIGAGFGQSSKLFLQQTNGSFQSKSNPDFEKDASREDAATVAFDADGDGDLDLYICSGGYHDLLPNAPGLRDWLYLNDGQGNFSRSINALPGYRESTKAVAVGDVNQDGHPDLFVGAYVVPGHYPTIPKSALLLNDGKGKFTDAITELAPGLQTLGSIHDAKWIDLQGDGQLELLVVGEWLTPSIFAMQDGQLVDQTTKYFDRTYKGWWNTIAVADFNQDGQVDFLIGNHGTNSQIQATVENPVEMIYKDFDQNGSIDPILTSYILGQSYPYLTRDELVKQLPYLRNRFTKYEDYANATIKDVFTPAELQDAKQLSANHLETTLFLSGTDGKYTIQSLPIEAQYAPVHAILVFDYDEDGNEDVLLAGNDHRMKLRLGSMEANYGTLLKGNGKGQFQYVAQKESGFRITGDVKAITRINDLLFFGVNQGPLTVYEKRKLN